MMRTMTFDLSDELQCFVQGLDLLAKKNFPVEEVLAYLKLNFFSPGLVDRYRFFSDSWYTRNLLYKTPFYELLLLCWQPGQESPIHGHEGEKCWMRIEEGSLLFKNYDVIYKSDHLTVDPVDSVEGHEGFVDGPAVIHSVANISDKPACSLHLYAKPFARCDIFDANEHKKARVDLNYYSVNGIIES